jgi:autonomous glycyl radical cofactor GrcA
VKANNLDSANHWLSKGYDMYPRGSKEQRAVVAKRLSLTDEFVKVGDFGKAESWLSKGFDVYPSGSEDQRDVVAKGVSLVDAFVQASFVARADHSLPIGYLDRANYWLSKGYDVYPSRSEEQRAVVAKGVSLVDAFVKANSALTRDSHWWLENFLNSVDNWLSKGYDMYPRGSKEQRAVVAKRLLLTDEFVKIRDFGKAESWLKRGYHSYPDGSEERKQIDEHLSQLSVKACFAKLGADREVNIAELRAIARKELGNIQTPVRGGLGIK